MRKNISIFVLTIILFISCVFKSSIVFAKNLSPFSIMANDENVKVGQQFTVTIKGENLKDLYAYESTINFDKEKIEFVKSEGLSEDGWTVKPIVKEDKIICAYTQIGDKIGYSGNLDLHKYTFKAKKTGTAKINLKSIEMVDSNLTTQKCDVDKEITINIKSGSNHKKTKTKTNTRINVIRVFGTDRIDTSIAISKKTWTSADTVILANAYNFPDALSGTTYAYMKNAPILLTASDNIKDSTLSEIKRLKASNVYILGGQGAISQNIEDKLKKQGLKVLRISGGNRYQTAIKAADTILNVNHNDTVFLCYSNNFADSLSVSTFAAKKGCPILYTDTNDLNTDTEKALKDWSIKKVFIIGGTGVIDSSIENKITKMGMNVERIGGLNRYDTAIKIMKHFNSEVCNGLTIASGKDFPDALTGSVFAAKNDVPIIIYDRKYVSSSVNEYIKSICKDKNLYILGGDSIVPQRDIDNIVK